jgi:hypothetical protein
MNSHAAAFGSNFRGCSFVLSEFLESLADAEKKPAGGFSGLAVQLNAAVGAKQKAGRSNP